jgi:hypothetical protein
MFITLITKFAVEASSETVQIILPEAKIHTVGAE